MELFDKILKKEYVLLFLVFILSFGFYLFILTRSPLMYGNDGPYYLIQVRSLFETSSLDYGDPPLSLFLFAFFSLLFNDITFGIKFSVAIFSALTTIPLYFWMKNVTHSEFSSYMSMFICTFSTSHIRLVNGLLKNTVGAFFLMCFIFYLHSIILKGDSKNDFLLCITFLILTALTHILDFGIALLFLVLYPLITVIFIPNKKNQLMKKIGFMVLFIFSFSILTYICFPVYFTDFSKVFVFLNDLFLGESEHSQIQYLFNHLGGIFVIPILTIGLIVSLYEWKMVKKPVTIVTVLIIGILLAFPLIPDGWYYRIVLMEFIPTSFIVGYVTSKITLQLFSTQIYQIIYILIITLLIAQSIYYSKLFKPSINEDNYQEIEFIARYIPNNSIIVCPQHRYWVQYITRSNVTKNLSEDLWSSYDNVFLFFDKRLSSENILPANSIKLVEKARFILYEVNESNLFY